MWVQQQRIISRLLLPAQTLLLIAENCSKWGRLYGFAATNNASTTVADTTGIGALGRPVQDDLTKMSKWDGKFIYSTSALKYNWLQINGEGNANPENAGMDKGAWYQQLLECKRRKRQC